MSDLRLFSCRPLTAQLTRAACGARHALGKDPTCATCAIGRLHRRGEAPTSWPAGEPITEILYRPGAGDISKARTRRRLAIAGA